MKDVSRLKTLGLLRGSSEAGAEGSSQALGDHGDIILASEGCEARGDFTAEGRPFASRGFGSFFCYLGERLGRTLEAASLPSLGTGLC